MPPSEELHSVNTVVASRRISDAVEMATRSDDDQIPLMPPLRRFTSRASLRTLHVPAPPSTTSSTTSSAWPIEEWLERESTKYPVSKTRLRELVDFSNLNYVGTVDENLICPICKMPFTLPITTPCDHTFCFQCLKQSCESNDVCPVDRKTFRPKYIKPASRLLRNQLDGLVVQCPNSERGCAATTSREDVVMHAHKCEYTLTRCPDRTCRKKVARWLARSTTESKCLHEQTPCPYCQELVEEAVLHEHMMHKCEHNRAICEACGDITKGSEMEEHRILRCAETEASCEYAEWGCGHKVKRKLLGEHLEQCAYRICSVLGQTIKTQQRQIDNLTQENAERTREVRELRQRQEDILGNGGSSSSPWDDIFRPNSRHENVEETVMGIYEELERRIEGVNKDLTDLDGRQTVMVLNEVMPIKNEITEIRSNMGILKMHVAWLMNKSREEVERTRLANLSRAVGSGSTAGTAASSTAGAGATSASARATPRRQGSSDIEGDLLSGPRRLSDSSNGIPRL